MKTTSSLIIIILASMSIGFTQQGKVQFVHCSADSALNEVDIWLDSSKVLDNFSFRSSSIPIAIDTGFSAELRVCPSNSTDTTNCFIIDSIEVSNNQRQQVFLAGFVTSGYSPFYNAQLSIHEVKTASSFVDYSEFGFYNGSSDIGNIDVLDITNSVSQLAGDVSFAERTDYSLLEAFNYIIQFRNGTSTNVIREIEFFLGDQLLSDSAFTVAITGFENTSANLNGPALGFHIVRNYGGPFIPLDNALAQIQIINNVPEKALHSLDFYNNDNLSADNLKFRNATGYLNVASGRTMVLAGALNTSTSANDSIVSVEAQLEYGKTYTFVLSGLNDASITPNKPLTFTKFESKKIANTGYNCDIAWVHGVSDVDQISVHEISQLGESLFGQSLFGELGDYKSIPAANYQVEIKNDLTDESILEYSVPLSELGGSAQTWVLSGFSDTNSSDSTNQIGVFVATQSGGEMKELSTSTGVHSPAKNRYQIFPNPSTGIVHIQNIRETAEYRLYGFDGQILKQGSATSSTLLNLKKLPSGIYTILVETGDYFQSERLIISN